MKRDPYLIPGCPCWLWDNKFQSFNIALFHGYSYDIQKKKEIPLFKHDNFLINCDKYEVIGTEWEFSLPSHICSTVDADGGIHLWKTIPEKPKGVFLEMKSWSYAITGFYCQDEKRFEGEAWLDSLIMRPAWAKKEKR